MLVTCWSAKGGSGATTVAVALATLLSRRDPHGAVLVDLCGDVPVVAGAPDPVGPGVAEWLAGGALVPADGLARLEQPLGPGLAYLPRGEGRLGHPKRAEVLAHVLAADNRAVVVDAGVLEPRTVAAAAHDVARALAAAASRSLLVTRACVLSVRRAQRVGLRPTGVVLVQGSRRALGRDDVEQVLGVPVVAEIPEDDDTARRVDAGTLCARLPRAVERGLRWAA